MQARQVQQTLGGWFPVDGQQEAGWLLEYVYDRGARRAMLAYRTPEGKVGVAERVDIGGVQYVPMEDEGVALSPDALGALKTTSELTADLLAFVLRHFMLEEASDYSTVADYVLLTWVYDAFDAVPYLCIEGEGKNEAAAMIASLCYRPVWAWEGAGTLKRLLHVYRGTALMREVDGEDVFDEATMILNVGAMRGTAKVWSMQEANLESGERCYKPVVCDVYGPKVVTLRTAFWDPSTEGRCLDVRSAGVRAGGFEEGAAALRNMLLRWRLAHWQPGDSQRLRASSWRQALRRLVA